ncbi:MAG: hypothetical protein M1338_00025 [Patescibacteria group bacterium]|nr:hypothetical protein [Patescibacteria group bacterium]
MGNPNTVPKIPHKSIIFKSLGNMMRPNTLETKIVINQHANSKYIFFIFQLFPEHVRQEGTVKKMTKKTTRINTIKRKAYSRRLRALLLISGSWAIPTSAWAPAGVAKNDAIFNIIR